MKGVAYKDVNSNLRAFPPSEQLYTTVSFGCLFQFHQSARWSTDYKDIRPAGVSLNHRGYSPHPPKVTDLVVRKLSDAAPFFGYNKISHWLGSIERWSGIARSAATGARFRYTANGLLDEGRTFG